MFQACIERMLNLTDHLRRLRVDKYEYIAMKVIVLLQSGKSNWLRFLLKPQYNLPSNRHIRFTGTGKSMCQSRESFASSTTVHVISLPGITIEIWWIITAHSWIATNLPGECVDEFFTMHKGNFWVIAMKFLEILGFFFNFWFFGDFLELFLEFFFFWIFRNSLEFFVSYSNEVDLQKGKGELSFKMELCFEGQILSRNRRWIKPTVTLSEVYRWLTLRPNFYCSFSETKGAEE